MTDNPLERTQKLMADLLASSAQLRDGLENERRAWRNHVSSLAAENAALRVEVEHGKDLMGQSVAWIERADQQRLAALAQRDSFAAENARLRAALERIADTDPDEGTAWFHDVALAALAERHERQEVGVMSDSLKPCPWCGETATATGEFEVECDGCCVVVPVSGRFWNNRPAEDDLAAENAALRSERDEARASDAESMAMFRRVRDERDALRTEVAELRRLANYTEAEVERLRAALVIWERNFPKPTEPLNQICDGTCVYGCQWLGCDQGCKESWRIEAYLWARLTEIYNALSERTEGQEVKE